MWLFITGWIFNSFCISTLIIVNMPDIIDNGGTERKIIVY